MQTIILDTTVHKQRQVVLLKFPYNDQLISLVRKIPTATWSNTHRAWCVNFVPEISGTIKDTFSGQAEIDETLFLSKNNDVKNALHCRHYVAASIKNNEIREASLQQFEKFKWWLQSKRYSESTIRTYLDAIRTFFKYYSTLSVQEINNDHIIDFNNNYILSNNLSASFQNQVVNAIKLFYKVVENKNIEIDLIHRPKRARVLPNVLSKEEVKEILQVHKNTKHRMMLSLIYSCGLRCNELLSLKPLDIDSKRNLIIIKQAKGKKDRIVPLSPKILEMLRNYYVAFKPTNFLFEGQKEGTKYDSRSLQMVLKHALNKVNCTKPVTLHWLRHSYATHLLEAGTDLRYIQELLGHSRSTTTEIYTHVSTKNIQNITSPFDTL